MRLSRATGCGRPPPTAGPLRSLVRRRVPGRLSRHRTDVGSAVNAALPVVHTVANVVAGATSLCAIEVLTRSAYGYVNNDPLNGVDPSGLSCGWTDPGGCVSDAAGAVGGVISDGAQWVGDHPWQTVGFIAGGVAALTGVGALADIAILGLDSGALGAISVGAGFVASGADVPDCIGGSTASCVGIGANLLGAGLGGAFLFAEEGRNLFGLLGSKAFSIGLGALAWDATSTAGDGQAC